MTSKGHKVTAMAFGGLLSAMMLTGYLVPPYPEQYLLGVVGLWFIGILFGASAPDWMEVVSFGQTVTGKRTRTSLIPHRTLTHWPPLWLLAGYLIGQQNLPWYAESFLFGFIASALLHIMMDALSKSGVPLLLPLASYRVRIPLYSTGSFSESVAIVVMMAGLLGASYLVLTGHLFDYIVPYLRALDVLFSSV